MAVAPLKSGQLRHRITIRRLTSTKTPTGGFTEKWEDIATVRAEVIGLDGLRGGHEAVLDQVLTGVLMFSVRIRWRSDILVSDQLRSIDGCFGRATDGQNFRDVNIRSCVDPDGQRRQLLIIADTASTRS
jgi:head-tail adaptor